MRRFCGIREGRKTFNQERVNPHELAAKVGRRKDEAYDMIHKPAHTVNPESGALFAAEVRPGDNGG